MPAALVKSIADDSGIDLAEADKRWKQAKVIAGENGLKESDGEGFWKYVTGVFKKSMGIGAVMESAVQHGGVWRDELYAAMAEDGFITESADAEWRLKPSVLGRLQGKALQEVRALGFDTEESVIAIDGSTIVYIRNRHGNQLTKDDEKYLRLAVTHPTEILPNVGTSFLTQHREKSVLFIYRDAAKDYLTIVEIGPKDGTNIVWNFWKLSGPKANKYLSKFRQEKARILAHGGATVNIPHVPPTDESGGKSEGLSESRKQEAGSGPTVSKDDKPVKPILESATAEEVHAAAHEAATSHLNDLPHPTQAQLEAGNYRHGHITMHGLRISIENPKGSKRSGIDPDGTPWEVTMAATYGFFKGTLAKDGDHVDCYIGDHPESELVFIVDQVDAKTGRYDEAKVYLGTLSQKEARDLYIAGFSDGKGAKRLGAMTAMHMPDFKEWLSAGDTTKPLSDVILEAAFTESDLREWAQRSPLAWKARILDAVSFDDIQAAFAQKWPGFIDPPSTSKIIETFRNEEDGTEARVAKVEKGYSVTLKDLDSGEVVPVANIYPDLETAIMKAKEAAGVINRLTNNQDGFKVVASTDKEGAMKSEVEVSRQNVTVAEFFRAIKAACEKKGLAFDLDRETFENPSRPSDDTYSVTNGVKHARYGKGEPTRESDGSDAPAKAETVRIQPYDYQCYIHNLDGSVFNEICEFSFDDEKRGHGYYYQVSRDADVKETEPTPATTDPDATYKEWEQSLNRKGAPTMQASRLIDAMLRSGIKRDEFKVSTERGKDGSFGDAIVKGTMSATVAEHTEALLRNGLNVFWYVPQGRDSMTAMVAAGKEWHSAEAHLDWAGEAGTLTVYDVVKFDARESGGTTTFAPDQMEEARALAKSIQSMQPAPAIPKNPKTGPQRVAVLRSIAAGIPGMQDYLARMDAVTTKREMENLDNDKFELIPSLRGSKEQIGDLDLYWTVADLRDQKEREINKRLKEEAQTAKLEKEQEKTVKKEQEDATLKRHKERPELKKVLDLISADFRTEIVQSITTRFTVMVERYFTDGDFNLLRPGRSGNQWENQTYARVSEELAPLMVPTRKLNPNWQNVMAKLASDSADFYIEQFENKMAWKLGDVLERKGGGDVALFGNVRDHAIRMTFPDKSGFQVRTQQVISTSVNGKVFARYPTTFHDVVLASGERMPVPSAAKMQKEFGITEDKSGE